MYPALGWLYLQIFICGAQQPSHLPRSYVIASTNYIAVSGAYPRMSTRLTPPNQNSPPQGRRRADLISKVSHQIVI